MLRLGEYIAFSILGVSLLLTGSHGAFLGLLVGVLYAWFAYRSDYIQRVTVVFTLGILAILIFCGWWVVSSEGAEWMESERTSLASRSMIWRSSLDIGSDNAFFGIGPGNFQKWYLDYQQFYSPYLEWAVPQPHNIYLAFWLQSGVLGVLGFFLIVSTLFTKGIRSINSEQMGIAKNETVFCLAFLVLFLIWGLVDTLYWNNDASVLFWIVAGTLLYQEINTKETF